MNKQSWGKIQFSHHQLGCFASFAADSCKCANFVQYKDAAGAKLSLTLFITRVRSPLSSSSGVGGKGRLGAPLDEAEM